MPKSRKSDKRDGRVFKSNVPTKFKIGNRKTGKSAMLMSVKELEAVLEDSNKKKFHNKARAALALRK